MPSSFTSGTLPPKNGHLQRPVVSGFYKKAGHSTEQCQNKPQAPPTVPFKPSPGNLPTNRPAPFTGEVPRRDSSQSYCTACKVYGHSPTWAKCTNNKSSAPAITLAVTNPKSLGPPAEDPIYVAPPRGSYPARLLKAFDDSGPQISLIRKDKVPYGATINRRKLITIEDINQFKMILPTVQLRVTRPHRSKIYNLEVASYIPGGYGILLEQDFQSPAKLRQSRGPNPPKHSLSMSRPQTPALITLPVPPKYDVQWPPPSRLIPDPIPVPGPAPMPVPGPQIDLSPEDPKLDSQSLPVPLACTEQCQAPSVPNNKQIPNKIIVPDPALVPAPEHASDLHSRDPNQDPLSPPSLAPLPVLVRETDPSNHSRSSTEGTASQPVPELAMVTCEPVTPTVTFSSLSWSPADTTMGKDSAMSQMADELTELQQLGIEPEMNTPASPTTENHRPKEICGRNYCVGNVR
ncbi:uncharacterized protein [Macrobrachium rosenbergii]|uniref:uncharacterized protein n=1 Tax=Macrobrachium rosenbergii TaxID=79674 RepID=UPI0034D50C2D